MLVGVGNYTDYIEASYCLLPKDDYGDPDLGYIFDVSDYDRLDTYLADISQRVCPNSYAAKTAFDGN